MRVPPVVVLHVLLVGVIVANAWSIYRNQTLRSDIESQRDRAMEQTRAAIAAAKQWEAVAQKWEVSFHAMESAEKSVERSFDSLARTLHTTCAGVSIKAAPDPAAGQQRASR